MLIGKETLNVDTCVIYMSSLTVFQFKQTHMSNVNHFNMDFCTSHWITWGSGEPPFVFRCTNQCLPTRMSECIRVAGPALAHI